MEVKIYHKKGTYTNTNGEERYYINFFVKCGTKLIPIEIKYFGKDGQPDTQYLGRKAILETFSEPFPEENT